MDSQAQRLVRRSVVTLCDCGAAGTVQRQKPTTLSTRLILSRYSRPHSVLSKLQTSPLPNNGSTAISAAFIKGGTMEATHRLLLAAACLFAASLACTQTGAYPNRPIRMIVPFAPGGASS